MILYFCLVARFLLLGIDIYESSPFGRPFFCLKDLISDRGQYINYGVFPALTNSPGMLSTSADFHVSSALTAVSTSSQKIGKGTSSCTFGQLSTVESQSLSWRNIKLLAQIMTSQSQSQNLFKVGNHNRLT